MEKTEKKREFKGRPKDYTDNRKELLKKEILDMYRKGMSRKRIVEEIRERLNISERQAYRVSSEVFAQLVKECPTDKEEVRETYLERLEYIIETAMSKGDYKTALKAQDIVNKLNMMYVEKQEIDLSIKNLEFKFGDE